MLLSESLTQAENIILLESYMDLEKLYGDTLNNINPDELKYAYNMVQTNKEIKNLIKKNLNLGLGGLEKAIVTKYPSPVDFINSVFQAKDNLEKNKAVQNQKSQDQLKRQNELKENETEDFYIIPCRTFEQAHKAAFSHTGNLLLMSNQKIKETYHIDSETFYETGKMPKEVLKFMKQAPFFMNPTWCVTAGKDYWDEYGLDSKEGEPCLCYIIISKQHPNIRFCITRRYEMHNSIENNLIKQMQSIILTEFRDTWQCGRHDTIDYGKDMFDCIKSVNIKNKVYKLIKPIIIGNTLIDSKKLVDGTRFFEKSNISAFSIDLPNLQYGSNMFRSCKNLSQFTPKLPNLQIGLEMFQWCENLSRFISELPSLQNGQEMFVHCKKLSRFISELPNLQNGRWMFRNCKNLSQFTSKLHKLEVGDSMFESCQLNEESILTILTSIPEYKEGEHNLGLGRNINFKNSKQIASLLGISVPIQPGQYNYKGWKIEIE